MSTQDWNHIRAFLATAETGSLSAAARELGLTQPTLSRQVAALEDDLGVMLFERLGRSLALTDAGRQLLLHSRKMGDAADAFAVTATSQSHDIQGLVRITASDLYSVYVLPKALRILSDRAPLLKIEIIADNSLRDIMRREADIAVRHVRPDQPDLVARRVCEAHAHIYAARSYFERHGKPETLAECCNHEFIGFGKIEEMVDCLVPLGIKVTADNFRFKTNSGLAGWELVKQGVGMAIMAEAAGAHSPGVVRVLPQMAPVVFPVWLTTHRELHTSRKIRLVFDVLDEVLSGAH